MFTPNYHVSPHLLATIKRITIQIHELNKRQAPQPLHAQMLSEARITSTYASTSIEGNPLPLTEVRRILKNLPTQIRQSEREVLNYNRTLSERYADLNAPFTAEFLWLIHRGIMQDLLPDEQVGRWRQEPVVIYEPRQGGIVYAPPDWQDVAHLMEDLIAFVVEQRGRLDPLLLAGLFHKQFVIIHPFVDGNGRTARLATNVLLAGLGLNLFPLVSFENYYNQSVTRYFQQVGLTGGYYELAPKVDFTAWLEYFAEGIGDELYRLEKQLDLHQATPQTRLEPHHLALLAYVDQHGLITDADYAKLTPRAKATRSLDFKRLLDLGLLVRKGRGRSIYYQRA